MLRRTKIVLAITLMVLMLVTAFSYLFISQILLQQVTTAHDSASYLSGQLAFLATNAVPDLTSTRTNINRPEKVKDAIAYYLGTDQDLNAMMASVLASWPTIYDAALVDSNGRVILHTDPELVGKQIPDRPSFQQIQNAGFRRQLRLIYNPPTVYDMRLPLKMNGQPFGSVRVGVSTVLVRDELTPRLRHALVLSLIAILLSLLLAAGLSRLALGPLEEISRSLDSVTGGSDDTIGLEGARADEYGLVTLKIAHLGRQMRDAREIFSALKDNVDQLMGNLQEGLMLFTRDSRVVLVSASVEKFLGRPRHELLGHTVKEIFSNQTDLGSLLLNAFQLRQSIELREIVTSNAKRVELSLDFIQEQGTSIGALLTLRDAESARRIEDEIEMSRRMSASGRITRGVAHEVKNPINAIVLHLQLLQNKLQRVDPDTRRHMDVIDSEIHRLDRVVQTLVDFTRPRDLHLEHMDLRQVLQEVVNLAVPDAEQHSATITRDISETPLSVKIDPDFIKQALLNVVLNGIQAMAQGGTLFISARRDGDSIYTEVRDEGAGIPHDVQEKIFELYFTTKPKGGGIGLAQTYQIMQWHYGSVEFESLEGRGTTFRLCLPFVEPKMAPKAIPPNKQSEIANEKSMPLTPQGR
jgi:signal transduction histidine kinase